jgi:hypothetical protein
MGRDHTTGREATQSGNHRSGAKLQMGEACAPPICVLYRLEVQAAEPKNGMFSPGGP